MSLRLRGRLDPGADSRAIVRWPGVRRPSHAEAEDWVGETLVTVVSTRGGSDAMSKPIRMSTPAAASWD